MGSFYMEATQINYRRDDTIKTVDQKLQELSQESAIDTDIAPVFKSTSSYEVGDLVYYRNKLYTCTTPHSGAWAASDFAATDVTTAIKSAAAVKADEADIASAFDATAPYAVGDLVYYEGTIYRCTNAHEGEWDADDFSATTISGELNAINSNLSHKVGIRVYTFADSLTTYSIPTARSSAYMAMVSIPLGANRVQDGFYLISRQGTEIVKKDIVTDDLTLTVTLSDNDMVLTWTASNPYGGSVELIPLYEVD